MPLKGKRGQIIFYDFGEAAVLLYLGKEKGRARFAPSAAK
jgi:predicted regulator of Ras-like GTPase activity (Roadblock/LC7/MglB family)